MLFLIRRLFRLLRGHYFRQRRHKQKQAQAAAVLTRLNTLSSVPQKLTWLRKINPFVFEELLLEAFKKRGYQVIRNKHYTGDGGIDGKVILHGKIWLIQAKRYRGYINPAHVSAFLSACEYHQCRGFFIHTGKTGTGLRGELNRSDNIILLSGDKLIRFLSV